MEICLTKGSRSEQSVLVVFVTILTGTFAAVLIFQFSIWMLFTFLVELFVVSVMLRISAKHFDIFRAGDLMLAKSIWGNRVVEIKDILNIIPIDFIVYYPANRYVKITLTKGAPLFTKLSTPTLFPMSQRNLIDQIQRLETALQL